MKKIFFLIYFIFLKFGLSFQCVPMFEYRIENNKLMFGSKIVEKADIETFEQLDVNFGKDKNHIYYKGKKVKNLDSKTFSVLQQVKYEGYCDKNSPYTSLKVLLIEEFTDINGVYWREDFIKKGILKLE